MSEWPDGNQKTILKGEIKTWWGCPRCGDLYNEGMGPSLVNAKIGERLSIRPSDLFEAMKVD